MTIIVWKHNAKRCNPFAPYTAPNGTQYPRVPPELYEEVSSPEVPTDYSEDTYYRTEQDDFPYVVYSKKSPEQIAEVTLARAKIARASAVSEITVETQSGNIFDGHDEAQNRMARMIAIMTDTDIIPWVLADNTIVQATKAELQEALRLSGIKMAELWVKPYSLEV